MKRVTDCSESCRVYEGKLMRILTRAARACRIAILAGTIAILTGGLPGAGIIEAKAGEFTVQDLSTRSNCSTLSSFPDCSALSSGWHKLSGNWYYLDPDNTLHRGWLQADGRTYFLDENGIMAHGWREVDGEWYYFHEDGGMNQGELEIGNAVYEFSKDGALKSARWADNTGGGAYNAGCYDDESQALFDELNEEKKTRYFDEHPDREEEYDGDMHRLYDRYAGFKMDMNLNKAAAHRLSGAMESGYMVDRIPGEGTVNDYLAAISYRRNATCLEVYVRGCEDEAEAFSKIMAKTGDRYDSKGDRRYALEYYRTLGMAHEEKDREHYFMIIFMR